MIRVGMIFDWWMEATSLRNILKNTFRELGKLMNEKKTFTIAGIREDTAAIGDINQHFNCLHIPNMGGYRFPSTALFSNNLILSPSGIDEVVLGSEVFTKKSMWRRSKPIIENEIDKWQKNINKVKIVQVVTNSEKEQMMQYLKIPEEKITIIPHGVNHNIFKPLLNKDECRKKISNKFSFKNGSYFIHVGEKNWVRKNILRILEAFKDAKHAGIPHSLIIVGKYEPHIIRRANDVEGVKVLGYVSEPDLVELLGSADALVLPSLHEGFGLPLVEAMSCGTPCITSNIFSPPEVVGDSGLLVDPYSVSEISQKMIDIAQNESLRAMLSKKSLQKSMSYSWEYTASKLLEVYEKCSSNMDEENFDENLDLAAYRTLTTICEMNSNLIRNVAHDLLEFDYSRIINWSLDFGLKEPEIRDYIIPFKEWMIAHSN